MVKLLNDQSPLTNDSLLNHLLKAQPAHLCIGFTEQGHKVMKGALILPLLKLMRPEVHY